MPSGKSMHTRDDEAPRSCHGRYGRIDDPQGHRRRGRRDAGRAAPRHAEQATLPPAVTNTPLGRRQCGVGAQPRRRQSLRLPQPHWPHWQVSEDDRRIDRTGRLSQPSDQLNRSFVRISRSSVDSIAGLTESILRSFQSALEISRSNSRVTRVDLQQN